MGTTPTTIAAPFNQIPVLRPDGSWSLPWLAFVQDVVDQFNRSLDNSLEARVTAIEALDIVIQATAAALALLVTANTAAITSLNATVAGLGSVVAAHTAQLSVNGTELALHDAEITNLNYTVGVQGLAATALTARVTTLEGANAALAGSPSYANDAAAAAGGVGVGQAYRNGSIYQVRVA
jgi:hypothetical protein